MRTIWEHKQQEVMMIARLKAAARRRDVRFAEDIIGVAALFGLLIFALSLPASY